MRRMVLAVVAALAAGFPWGPLTALAAEEASLTLSQEVVAPGGGLDVSGSGFAESSGVSLSLEDGAINLGRVSTDGEGAFTSNVVIPSDVTEGRQSLTAAGIAPDGGARILVASLLVSGDPDAEIESDEQSGGVGWVVPFVLGTITGALIASGVALLLRRRSSVPEDAPHQESA